MAHLGTGTKFREHHTQVACREIAARMQVVVYQSLCPILEGTVRWAGDCLCKFVCILSTYSKDFVNIPPRRMSILLWDHPLFLKKLLELFMSCCIHTVNSKRTGTLTQYNSPYIIRWSQVSFSEFWVELLNAKNWAAYQIEANKKLYLV